MVEQQLHLANKVAVWTLFLFLFDKKVNQLFLISSHRLHINHVIL